MAILIGRGPTLNNLGFADLTPLKSDPIVSRGYRVEGLTIWTMSDKNGDYQVQYYVPDGTEAPEEFKESNWKNYGLAQAITAGALHKYQDDGGFLATRTVFTPAAQPGKVYQEVTFFGGG